MQFRKCLEGDRRFNGSRGFPSGRTIAVLVATAALSAVAQPGQQALLRSSDRPYIANEAANRLPDANEQMIMHEQQEQKQDFESANAVRRKLLTDESAKLLQLAAQLKTEMDKTDKDTLSIGVIRKAEQIEKLAKDVKAQMKLTIGQS
ncbi:MAG TPA: hypothetical protein VLZ50_00940 [Terracidiphilus sp.]|nr:hypothetical protein [Terracidiphilus sp.]